MVEAPTRVGPGPRPGVRAAGGPGESESGEPVGVGEGAGAGEGGPEGIASDGPAAAAPAASAGPRHVLGAQPGGEVELGGLAGGRALGAGDGEGVLGREEAAGDVDEGGVAAAAAWLLQVHHEEVRIALFLFRLPPPASFPASVDGQVPQVISNREPIF